MMLGQAMRDQQRELTVFRNRLMLLGFAILVAFGLAVPKARVAATGALLAVLAVSAATAALALTG